MSEQSKVIFLDIKHADKDLRLEAGEYCQAERHEGQYRVVRYICLITDAPDGSGDHLWGQCVECHEEMQADIQEESGQRAKVL